MTIAQIREIQGLLEKRNRIDSKINSLVMLTKGSQYKEDVETFDVMIVSGVNNLQEKRNKVTERLKELGLEE